MKCKKCGFPYEYNHNYCNNCGNDLRKNKGKIDIGLLVILVFGLLSFLTIGGLTYYSLTTITKPIAVIEEDYYNDIVGEWVDTSHNNLIRISNKAVYNWFQDYNNDKNSYISGSMKVKIKSDALNDLNVNIDNIKKLLNIEDITVDNIYLLRLYTNKDNLKYSYYKMLCVRRDDELIIYNYNDKVIMHLIRNI